MNTVTLLWDASHLWGLLAWQALRALGVPCRLLKAENITHALTSDKSRLLLVPGGTASRKADALGKSGIDAVRRFVAEGGHYLGFCGGAGLGLSDETGLGLCPWKRAGFTDRLQHFVSGHVRADVLHPHALVPRDLPLSVHIPVWWPGRFAVPVAEEPVTVLARYAGPGPDLHMSDFMLASLPETVRHKWLERYQVCLTPETLRGEGEGEPCIIHGQYGKGTYTLSYSHLETPDSPEANSWFAHMIEQLAGCAALPGSIPPWSPASVVPVWSDPVLMDCARKMDALMVLGRTHGLLFDRTPWLTGWKSGVPGAGLNSLHMALHMVVSREPTPQAKTLWQSHAALFAKSFELFYHETEELLLARRLAATLPDAVPAHMLQEQRHRLFGSAMHGGGMYQQLMNVLDAVLFLVLQAR